MKTPISVCPVPLEQQPIHEYQSLRESWFYRWATGNLRGFVQPIVLLWALSWLVTGPIAAVSFRPFKAPFLFGLSASLGALVIPTLALVQLYLGWRYVRHRLHAATIPYEESGWYDGQTWTKPEEVVARDRLIVEYQIKPILTRLHRTFTAIAIGLGLGAITWLGLA